MLPNIADFLVWYWWVGSECGGDTQFEALFIQSLWCVKRISLSVNIIKENIHLEKCISILQLDFSRYSLAVVCTKTTFFSRWMDLHTVHKDWKINRLKKKIGSNSKGEVSLATKSVETSLGYLERKKEKYPENIILKDSFLMQLKDFL